MKKLIFLILLSVQSFAFAADVITVTAVGDVMLGTNFPQNRLPPNQGQNLLYQATKYFKSADIRFANFEDTFFDGPAQPDGKSPGPNRFLFRTPPEFVERLVEAGVNVVSLANNHAKDFGSAGIRSSKAVLSLAGIQNSSKEGKEVAQFNVRGTSVALIAADFYPGSRSVTSPDSTTKKLRISKKPNPLSLFQLMLVAKE